MTLSQLIYEEQLNVADAACVILPGILFKDFSVNTLCGYIELTQTLCINYIDGPYTVIAYEFISR